MNFYENLKPLEEHSPNRMNRSPPNRRSSLGFECVSIPTSSNTFDSKIPQPPQPQIQTQLSNVSFQSRIMAMQQRLARKPPPANVSFQEPSYQYPNITTELQEAIYNITEEINNKQNQLDHYEEELQKLRRIYRNHEKKVVDINSEFINFQLQFDYFSEEIIRSVQNEEKMIEIKLKENQIKLDNQLKEFEFEMKNEMEEIKNIDYSLLIEKLDKLKNVEKELNIKIEKQQIANDEEVAIERKRIKDEYDTKISTLQEELKKNNEIISQKQSEFNELNVEFQQALNELDIYNAKIESTKQQINTIEQTMTNFKGDKQSIELQLNELDNQLKIKTEQSNLEQPEFNKVQEEYRELISKIQKHDEHRRILENSIMNYESKNIRIYAISNEEEYIDNIVGFDKVFKEDTPYSSIYDEFSLFITNILNGQNISIISQFIPGTYIIFEAMKNLLNHDDIKIDYQCMNETTDLLTNSLLPTNSIFGSQKMIVNDLFQVKRFIDDNENNGVLIHVLTVSGLKNGKVFESKLVLMDIKKVDLTSQINILKNLNVSSSSKNTSSTDKLIQWISTKSKNLIITEINNFEILEILKNIKNKK
ncbi:uncharacterized protein KGF55_000774 [Candida pseudojiufengensis]|uniref:uncharacterized protein n=1 Tax=Candida pseudojiufengensis TaxID=497109 RepID=UPI002224AC3F|nr:uncharacterized protein KGF55_000774 [Candida pseudojiufengensis]KAI5966465.1 hypothetical protein KGF55_000774 [Candida pseudojiufengensis]